MEDQDSGTAGGLQDPVISLELEYQVGELVMMLVTYFSSRLLCMPYKRFHSEHQPFWGIILCCCYAMTSHAITGTFSSGLGFVINKRVCSYQHPSDGGGGGGEGGGGGGGSFPPSR